MSFTKKFLFDSNQNNSGGGSSSSNIPFGIATGINTYSTTISGLSSLNSGQAISIKFTNSNTNTCTLNISGHGTYNMYKFGNEAFASGDIKNNQILIFIFDGTELQCQSVTDNIMESY